jgi:predicted nucleotidyltransferase
MITLNEIITESGLSSEKILNVYIFGSQIYGTRSEKSDIDILIISDISYHEKEIERNNLNIHITSYNRFLDALENHHFGSIECAMSPMILKEDKKINFELNSKKLRHSVSWISSNSWVKCKKKLQQGDYNIDIKSLFHSIRILLFAIQIMKYGKIVDFKEANYIWYKLISKNWNWSELQLEFNMERNNILTKFRILANK